MMLTSIVASGVELPMADYSELLSDLRARRNALKRSLDRLDKMIADIEQATEILGSQPLLFSFEASKGAIDPVDDESRRVRGELPPETIARYARETLLAVGRPLKRGELVQELLAKGVPLAGKDKNKNLGTILWRHSDSFVRLDGLGYWPRDVSISGVYEPDKD